MSENITFTVQLTQGHRVSIPKITRSTYGIDSDDVIRAYIQHTRAGNRPESECDPETRSVTAHPFQLEFTAKIHSRDHYITVPKPVIDALDIATYDYVTITIVEIIKPTRST